MTSLRVRHALAAGVLLAASACASGPGDGRTEVTGTSTTPDSLSTARTVSSTAARADGLDTPPADGPVAPVAEPERVEYDTGRQQYGELWMPSGVEMPPVVVLIHGGFWSTPYDLTLMDPLAEDLVARGDAVWNIEYRRLGESGGGWPGTFDDVAAAIDHLRVIARDRPIDLDRVVLVGHSAGGQLAMWAAGRSTLPVEAPGAGPLVTPILAIGQGPVVDLAAAADQLMDGGIVIDLLGGTPVDVPDRYAWATPSVVGDVPLVAVVGSDDTVVPAGFSVEPSAPTAIEIVMVPGADHFDLIDPASTAWTAVTDRLAARSVGS